MWVLHAARSHFTGYAVWSISRKRGMGVLLQKQANLCFHVNFDENNGVSDIKVLL